MIRSVRVLCPKMVGDSKVQMVTQREVISMIAPGLTKDNGLMSPIVEFVATTARHDVGKAKYVNKEGTGIEPAPLSSQSSHSSS